MTEHLHVLRAAGTCVVVDARGPGAPCVLHWGRDLGDLGAHAAELLRVTEPVVGPSSVDVPQRLSLLPGPAEGWTGRPGVSGHRAGAGPRSAAAWPAWTLTGSRAGADRLWYELADPDAGLVVQVEIGLTEHGVVHVTTELSNTGASDYVVAGLMATLPVPGRARQVLDLTGRWPVERMPQRHDLAHGTWSRESRHGRPGHDSAYLLTVGVPGFGFRHGEVWSTALAWSGSSVLWAERAATGHTSVGAGELLHPGEVVLAPGESYRAPTLLAAWSDAGMDGVADRFHDWVRAAGRRRTGGAPAPRPVVLNTWEAVYFDHSADRLGELARVAASVGVERFVLDDGWFAGRRSDRTSLGDWTVDPTVWPDGLGPLIRQVRDLGMEFGLWVEPEMISLDSELARRHPDWVLGPDSGRRPLPWRHQHVLDLGNPDAYAWVLDALSDLLAQNDIAFLKWDHNRDLVEGPAHAQTLAVYRLLDELHTRFPRLAIESCASGGARVDLGIVTRVDRFWPSDTNDAHERQRIQRWTGALLPPEYIGSHVGPGTAHTTGRRHRLGFRLATALLGHAGIEWDLTRTDEAERAALRAWTDLYRRLRPVLHTGRTVRVDRADESTWVHGVVAADRSQAVFVVATMAAQPDTLREPLRLAGLDPEGCYDLQFVDLGGPAASVEDAPPPWWTTGRARLPGAVLMDVGLALPALLPDEAVVLHLRRSDHEETCDD